MGYRVFGRDSTARADLSTSDLGIIWSLILTSTFTVEPMATLFTRSIGTQLFRRYLHDDFARLFVSRMERHTRLQTESNLRLFIRHHGYYERYMRADFEDIPCQSLTHIMSHSISSKN